MKGILIRILNMSTDIIRIIISEVWDSIENYKKVYNVIFAYLHNPLNK